LLGRPSLYYWTKIQGDRFHLLHCHLKTETDPVPKMLRVFSRRWWTVSKISVMPDTIMTIVLSSELRYSELLPPSYILILLFLSCVLRFRRTNYLKTLQSFVSQVGRKHWFCI
jgi:hypothetical protein